MRHLRWMLAAILLAFISTPKTSIAAVIDSIGFKVDRGQSIVNIQMQGDSTYRSNYNATDRQLVLNIDRAKLATSAKRALDASSFDSPVKLVSPFQVTPDQVKVVVQLNKDLPGKVNKIGDRIELSFGAAPEEDDGFFEEGEDFGDISGMEFSEEPLNEAEFQTDQGEMAFADNNQNASQPTAEKPKTKTRDPQPHPDKVGAPGTPPNREVKPSHVRGQS